MIFTGYFWLINRCELVAIYKDEILLYNLLSLYVALFSWIDSISIRGIFTVGLLLIRKKHY